MIQLKKIIQEEQQQFLALKENILFLQSSSLDETKIREMWNQIEQEKVQKEREQVRYDQWLKEREEKKAEMERQWRPNYGLNKSPSVAIKQAKSTEEADTEVVQQQQQQSGTSAPSPLLTSLLKSPSQANQMPLSAPVLHVARLAPTITNLLTAGQSPSTATNSPLMQSSNSSSSLSTPNTLINQASIACAQSSHSQALVHVSNNIHNIDHSASSIQIPASQTAPTLITLLDKKSQPVAAAPIGTAVQDQANTHDKHQNLMVISVPEPSISGAKDGHHHQDEEAELLADFNDLMSDGKLMDIEDLEDLNNIIMNPEILDEKSTENEQIKDAEESIQNNATDDYDKLRIKQIVETIQDFAGVPEPEIKVVEREEPQEVKEVQPEPLAEVDDLVVPQLPEEPEFSEPASADEVIEPPNESPAAQDEKHVMIISDESSNTNDEKPLMEPLEKIEEAEEEESKEILESESQPKPEQRAFQAIETAKMDENSGGSEKEPVKDQPTVFTIDDSDEDGLFHDAKENQDETQKVEKLEIETVQEPIETNEASSPVPDEMPKPDSISLDDSDEEIIVMKAGRGSRRDYSRKKTSETTSSVHSTRSRDHSENDDNNSNSDSTPIRTRSRHSSTYVFTNDQDHTMWKGKWKECMHQLQEIPNYSIVIDSKSIPDESQKTVIYCPMNMKTIHKNIDNNISTMCGDVKRDFALMCTNIVMWNKKDNPKFNETVNQFMKDGLDIIDAHMDVDEVYKQYRAQIKKKNN